MLYRIRTPDNPPPATCRRRRNWTVSARPRAGQATLSEYATRRVICPDVLHRARSCGQIGEPRHLADARSGADQPRVRVIKRASTSAITHAGEAARIERLSRCESSCSAPRTACSCRSAWSPAWLQRSGDRGSRPPCPPLTFGRSRRGLGCDGADPRWRCDPDNSAERTGGDRADRPWTAAQGRSGERAASVARATRLASR